MAQETKATEKLPENKMGTMPVKRLVLSMSLPMMVSMLVQALYNVVDSIFVAQLSENALTAVTLAFPMQSLLISVGSGTGVGVNALLSQALGRRDEKTANAAANTALLLTVCNSLVFLLLGQFAAAPFLGTQTSDAEILGYGISYLSVVCSLSFGAFFQIMLERLLQSTGLTVFSMISQLTGAIVNLILDPIMIFGYFGCPALGVAGAAYATVIGQCCAALLGLALNLKKNRELSFFVRSIFRPKASIIRRIYAVGIPSILMMSIGSVMTYAMNRILMAFSATATAVFGVYFKLQSFFFMPIFGLNNGIIPILAYNYGARKKDRIREAIRFEIFLAACIMLCGTLCFELFPNALLSLFNASENLRALGVPALRIIAIHFPIAAIGISMGSVFQAFSKSTYSLIVSICRQLLVLIPAAWLLSLTGNVQNVWWSFLIAEFVSMVISLALFGKLKKDVIDKL